MIAEMEGQFAKLGSELLLELMFVKIIWRCLPHLENTVLVTVYI